MDRKQAKLLLAFSLVGLFLTVTGGLLFADEMVHKFKNPSFSGQGTSAHYLTI